MSGAICETAAPVSDEADFHGAVRSLSAKLLAVITSHAPVQFEVVAAAVFAVLEAIVVSAPEDAGDSVAALQEALAELQRHSTRHPSDTVN